MKLKSVISYTQTNEQPDNKKKPTPELTAPKWDKNMETMPKNKQTHFSMVSGKEKEVIMKKLILNTTKNLILILTVLFLLWILISWLDIVAHNDPWRNSHEYMPGNAFSVLVHEYD